jgi:hypothetical protein
MLVILVHMHGRVFVAMRRGRESFAVGIYHCGAVPWGPNAGGAWEDAFAAEVDDPVDGHGGCEAEEEAREN